MKKLFLSSFLLSWLVAPVVFAQNQLQLLAPLPQSILSSSNVPDPAIYIKALYQFGLGIAGALAMLMIVWGAVQWVVSGAVDRKAAAKQRIWKAILGLILLLSAVLILNIINPNLTNLQTIIPPL